MKIRKKFKNGIESMSLMFGLLKVIQAWNEKQTHGIRVFNLHWKDTFMIGFMRLILVIHKNKRKWSKEKLSKWLYLFLQFGMDFIQDILSRFSIGPCCFKFRKSFSEWRETHLNLQKSEKNSNFLNYSL